jgi:predicted O-methyltransferase YrrM
MSIEQQLGLKFPIHWNESAAEEKYVKYLIYKIITKRPINVVELGSGLSSIIITKTLENLGYDYSFTSFDADEAFLNETKNLLISEDLYDESKIKIVHSPIEDIEINGNVYKWYSAKDFKFDFEKIDLLFIDGPVGPSCKNARYPAINVLKKYLKEGSLVLLHDAKRPDEIEIVEMWKNENPEITKCYKIDTERGGAEIYFQKEEK